MRGACKNVDAMSDRICQQVGMCAARARLRHAMVAGACYALELVE